MNFQDFETDIVAKAKSAHVHGMDWQDIAQEFRIAIWRNQHRFDPKRASARTFAVRIMRNKLIDLARRSQHIFGIAGPPPRKPKKMRSRAYIGSTLDSVRRGRLGKVGKPSKQIHENDT